MQFTALTFESSARSATGAVELALEPKRPIRFRAGQGGLFFVPGAGAKPFTFAGDDRADRLSIATTLGSSSRFKRALAQLRSGDRVRVVGPIGTRAAIDPADQHVFVAQGIGITPFLSMARSNGWMEATLLQVGTPQFFDEVAVATRNAEHHDHRAGLRQAMDRAIADPTSARWSVSGRSDFVAAVAARLRDAGIPSRRIPRDAFWGQVRLPSEAQKENNHDDRQHRSRADICR